MKGKHQYFTDRTQHSRRAGSHFEHDHSGKQSLNPPLSTQHLRWHERFQTQYSGFTQRSLYLEVNYFAELVPIVSAGNQSGESL